MLDGVYSVSYLALLMYVINKRSCNVEQEMLAKYSMCSYKSTCLILELN